MLLGVPGRRLLMGAGILGLAGLLTGQTPTPTESESEIDVLKRRIENATNPERSPRLTEAGKNELLKELEEGRIEEVRKYLDDLERRQRR